jgi:hypothetical protein
MTTWNPVGQVNPHPPDVEGQWANLADLTVEIDTQEVVDEVLAALEPPVDLVTLIENNLL